MVLLDMQPDQAMIEEGVAREVINRMQKLRKKAGLVPTDQVTVYFGVTPQSSDLYRVTAASLTFIESAIKMPVKPRDQLAGQKVIMDENQQV